MSSLNASTADSITTQQTRKLKGMLTLPLSTKLAFYYSLLHTIVIGHSNLYDLLLISNVRRARSPMADCFHTVRGAGYIYTQKKNAKTRGIFKID